MKLYIMRHGQTDMNVQGKMQGHINCPLNDTGRSQARAAAEVIRAGELSFDRIITSSLDRTRETAELATGVPREKYETDDRLIEIDYGELDGLTYEQMGPEMQAFLKDPVNLKAPEGVEDLDAVMSRARSFLQDIAEEGVKNPDLNILVVSHGVTIRAMIGCILGIERPDRAIWGMPIDNCSILETELVDSWFEEVFFLK